jgi:SAM-dependent methyltransferase
VEVTAARRRLGAWYTPDWLVDVVVELALHEVDRSQGSRTLRVLDPACGDGRFLRAVAERLDGRCELVGVDIDDAALSAAADVLSSVEGVRLMRADALTWDWHAEGAFDLVIGNPPFVSPLSSHTPRRGSSGLGGGPYADVAVEFLSLAHRLARAGSGRVAFVLPTSVLSARDAAPVRAAIDMDTSLRSCWWSHRPVFEDAVVQTCAVVLERGTPAAAATTPVSARVGAGDVVSDVRVRRRSDPSSSWSWLLAELQGAPQLDVEALDTAGILEERGTPRADFRQHYYGLVGNLMDGDPGPAGAAHRPPLVTSGLIDPGSCSWGRRRVRFAGDDFAAPRVVLEQLTPGLRAWAQSRLVPKVLVANQTRVVEAYPDVHGEFLGSVPVISILTTEGSVALDIAAVLTSPVVTAWAAREVAGSGRGGGSLRLSAPLLGRTPWPAGDLGRARRALSAGDVVSCGVEVTKAFGLRAASATGLVDWWASALPRRAR